MCVGLVRSKTARCISRHVCFVPKMDIAHAINFRVFLATSIKARSFGKNPEFRLPNIPRLTIEKRAHSILTAQMFFQRPDSLSKTSGNS
jgi:hypothetical protein